MTFLALILVLLGTVALAPWFGKDSRPLDPNHFTPTHPLHRDAGANC